ncbi:MAG TPA: deoxyguanosinetriphosphate triphosphohydrolase [bacterium]
MPLTPREVTEAWEDERLDPRAARASASRGREVPEPEDDLRTAFQRDRDRIIHSKSFRRLKHKTQVFLAPEGDHYRTRLTHTLEVAQVARTASRALRLNEDLTEAVALAHDLGHPPFGHAGEAALDAAMAGVGGFKHDEQSLRVVDRLEVRTRSDGMVVRGLNLTWEVRDGIAGHSKGLADLPAGPPERLPATLEGQIVRLADRIAYVHHDTDDAVRAGVIREDEVPPAVREVLGETRARWLGVMVHDLVGRTASSARAVLSDEVRIALNRLKDFLSERLYHGSATAEDVSQARALLRALYDHHVTHPEALSPELQILLEQGEPLGRVVGDFVAGMTDRYAIHLADRLFGPRYRVGEGGFRE